MMHAAVAQSVLIVRTRSRDLPRMVLKHAGIICASFKTIGKGLPTLYALTASFVSLNFVHSGRSEFRLKNVTF